MKKTSFLIAVLVIISILNSFAIVGLYVKTQDDDDDDNDKPEPVDNNTDNKTKPNNGNNSKPEPPTYSGVVHGLKFWYSDVINANVTTVRIDDNISFTIRGEWNGITLFLSYDFWVDDNYHLLKYCETPKKK